jgi:predicted PurR-regulated permease PerM
MPMDTHRSLTWVIFLAAASGAAYVCLSILRPFASVIAWSGVLAIICYPVHQSLVRKTGHVAVSAFMTSVLAVLAILIPLLGLAGIAVNQALALGHSPRGAFQPGDGPLQRMWAAFDGIAGRAGVDQATIADWIQQHIADWGQRLGQYTVSFAAGLFDALVSSLFIVLAMFLLLRDGPDLVRTVPDFLPFERDRSEALLRRIADVVRASVSGVVVIALLQGALYGAMFALIGLPSAALWAMVTVFASVFPVVGALAVWGPAAVYLAATGHWPQAIVLVIWAFVVNAIDHVVRPRLVAGRVGLSELAMFFALLGGLSVFGGLGVVLGPVAFATVAAIVDTLRQPAPPAMPADVHDRMMRT